MNTRLISSLLTILAFSPFALRAMENNPQEGTFQSSIIDAKCISAKTKVAYCIDGEEIGSIEYIHLPGSIYSMQSFYVRPEHRNKGYGRKIFEHACRELEAQNPRRVFINPGAFEIVDGREVPVEEPTPQAVAQLLRIKKFYRKSGFRNVSNTTFFLVSVFYRIIKRNECTLLLMEK